MTTSHSKAIPSAGGDEERGDSAGERRDAALVPRLGGQGYRREQVASRRAWIEERTGCRLEHVGSFSIPAEEMRGNIENPVGAVQVPLGIAGPLEIRGEHADGVFYVPLATTEGALVRSYERGMVALSRSGGATARLVRDENRVCPIFVLPDLAAAVEFSRSVPGHLEGLRTAADATTRHGRLLAAEARPIGREVIVEMRFQTGDAQGMNMISRAAEAACRWLVQRLPVDRWYLFSGAGGEKRAAGSLMAGGKGKTVLAGARLSRPVVESYLRTSPEALVDLWRRTLTGHLHAAALGYNGHFANGLAALFLATGQDLANVANSAVGITSFEVGEQGELHVSVTLPALTVATVGGGTCQGTALECLGMLGCAGANRAEKLSEIVAATLLAGEISFGAALAANGLVEAHEAYGRNRPTEPIDHRLGDRSAGIPPVEGSVDRDGP